MSRGSSAPSSRNESRTSRPSIPAAPRSQARPPSPVTEGALHSGVLADPIRLPAFRPEELPRHVPHPPQRLPAARDHVQLQARARAQPDLAGILLVLPWDDDVFSGPSPLQGRLQPLLVPLLDLHRNPPRVRLPPQLRLTLPHEVSQPPNRPNLVSAKVPLPLLKHVDLVLMFVDLEPHHAGARRALKLGLQPPRDFVEYAIHLFLMPRTCQTGLHSSEAAEPDPPARRGFFATDDESRSPEPAEASLVALGFAGSA
eukprot:CAMPEP_0113710932 /NCGR_PEP_ID=MMETSP0038_2-20120614/30452_1 /TAXON_ID=2898 /ORGANISM="Cryptomonas paramecium" /LENGTH=256 /DNA_ID=CAMNT_0000637085 /DNA_START=32 /DNA_END=800 /DNA_ORIENTATION=+ /assembly_acc=CAM_ASM_000170